MSVRSGQSVRWWRPAVLLGLTAGLGAAACPKSEPAGPTIVALVIEPPAVTLGPGEQTTFHPIGKTPSGDSVPATVRFAATGGSITSAGVYTAGTVPGSYHVIGTLPDGSKSDTAAVTIQPPPPAPVATVTVTPPHPSITAGTTVSLTATTRDSNGAVLTGRVVTWSSGTTAVGTIDVNGVVTGVATGTTVIIATSEGKQGKDTVTVTAPTATLVRINLTPDSTAVDTGHTAQFTVTGKFSDSSAATVPATFTATGGGVSGSGLYTAGAAAGSFRVIATAAGGLADTSKVVVVAAATTTAECASPQPGWIWCDDFEQDRLASYFETDGVGTVLNRVAGVGKDNSYGMKGHFAAGASTAGDLHLAFGKTPGSYFAPVDAGTANYREIYWRMYVKAQAGWVGGAHDKLSRALSFGNTNFGEAIAAHVWGGDVGSADTMGLILDPASGIDSAGNLVAVTYNDPHLKYLGQAKHSPHPTPIFDAAHVGQWYCVEAHVKLNDSGSSNGVFELWVNDSLEAQQTGMNWISSYSAFGINAIYFENYWNDGATVAEDRFFDNIVVSTQRIGC